MLPTKRDFYTLVFAILAENNVNLFRLKMFYDMLPKNSKSQIETLFVYRTKFWRLVITPIGLMPMAINNTGTYCIKLGVHNNIRKVSYT